MSREGLEDVVDATLLFQQQILFAQEGEATLTSSLALVLADLYRNQREDLDERMKHEPKTSSHSSKSIGMDVQEWQVEFNNANQMWQNAEAPLNATLQSTNQDMSVLANSGQTISQLAASCTQAVNCTARLISQSYG